MNVSAIGSYGSTVQALVDSATRSELAQTLNAGAAQRSPSFATSARSGAAPQSDDASSALLQQPSARTPTIELLSGLVAEADTRANSSAPSTESEDTPLVNPSPLFDPADVDGDGIVTLMEQLSYDLTHPGTLELIGAEV